jgi:hypothetical protein
MTLGISQSAVAPREVVMRATLTLESRRSAAARRAAAPYISPPLVEAQGQCSGARHSACKRRPHDVD